VLQEREFERVGDTQTIRVDVRVIAASNRDLQELADKDEFREDLYYRLNVVPIHLPPLRQRREDIPELVGHFLTYYNEENDRYVAHVEKRAMEALQDYHWPGNVRELQNVIERAVILSVDGRLELDDSLAAPVAASRTSENRSLEDLEREHILSVLESVGWRVSGDRGAARILGLKRTTLEARLRKLGISRPR